MKTLLAFFMLFAGAAFAQTPYPEPWEFPQDPPWRPSTEPPRGPACPREEQIVVLHPISRTLAEAKLAELAIQRSATCTLDSASIRTSEGTCLTAEHRLRVIMDYDFNCRAGTTSIYRTKIYRSRRRN